MAGLYRVALDGSGATLLAQLSNTSLLGIHQDKLIFEYESCPGQSRHTSCLGTLPIAGGTPSPNAVHLGRRVGNHSVGVSVDLDVGVVLVGDGDGDGRV